MNGPEALPRVADRNLAQVLAAERAALILAKSDCGYCAAYEREILELQRRGALAGLTAGKLVLDAPGSPRFKRKNPWITSLAALPYTLLFVNGELVDHFAASKGALLRERLGSVRPPAPA